MKRRWSAYGLLALFAALALAGCGIQSTVAPRMPITVVPTVDQAKAYPLGTPVLEALPPAYPYPIASEPAPAADGQAADAALIALAKQDLAQRLAVTADQISVVSSAYMDWPDSSLGCPKPGMAYAQVITPGYRIVLAQAQKQYDYHTNLAGQLALCAP